MEATQIMKFVETLVIAFAIFLVYHCVMKISQKAIARKEEEQEAKKQQKAAQRQRMREILEEKKNDQE